MLGGILAGLARGGMALLRPSDGDGDLPEPRREPPIIIAPDFKTVRECKDTIAALDLGQFMIASWLIEQMLCQVRLRSVTETRLAGLVGTEIRWEPGRDNDLGRRAARDIATDWPLMVTGAVRAQLAQWGLYLGVGFAQKHWYESPSSGRMIPRLENYHPQWSIWDWSLRAYRIWTMDGWSIVPSPSLSVPGQPWSPPYGVGGNQQPDTLKRWLIHEPWGQHSWRRGLVHAAWDPWLALTKANRNMHRSSEKMGVGITLLKYPKTTDSNPLNLLISYLRRLGSESVIPLEQYPEGGPMASYDAKPFEWTQSGADIISRDREACSADLGILLLGHNTTAETKGASVGASAQVGNLIRGDIRVKDTCDEWATLYLQLIRDWAEVNYGDSGLAPIPIYVVDPPSENQAAAQTLLWFFQALALARQNSPGTDFDELHNRFRIPMKDGGAKVPAPKPETAPTPATPAGNGKEPEKAAA